jgi:peroxiredoxin
MRYIVCFIAGLLMFTACSKEKKIIVKGVLTHAKNETVYLKQMALNNLVSVDSSVINDKGMFKLRGKASKPGFYILTVSSNNYATLLINPGDKLHFEADIKDINRTYKVKGAVDAELVNELNDKLNLTLDKISVLGQTYEDSLHSPNILNIRAQLDSTFDVIANEHRQYTFLFIKKNLNSLASLMALYQQLGPKATVLSPSENFEYFSMVDSALILKYPEVDAVQSLHTLIGDLAEQQVQKAEKDKKTAIGIEAPEIALPDMNGNIIKLSQTLGKYVLLDFWASWCEPCRQENPTLVKAYWKYKSKGFEIFQVSLDRSKESWVKCIQEQKLTWLHVSDLKYWDSSVVPQFGIEGIPYNLLLDPNGVIIAKNLIGNELEEKLKGIFKY